MDNKKRIGVIMLFAFGLIVGLLPAAMAQLPTITSNLDKTELLIGEQATLKIKASFTDDYTIAWFAPPDSLPHFELVQAGKIDTLRSNGTVQLEQALTFTCFDSGQWKTPPFTVAFQQPRQAKPLVLYADTLAYKVGFAADTTAEIRDIKPIIDAEEAGGWPWRLILYIGLGAIATLALIIWLLYKWIRKGADKKVVVGSATVYQQAMQQLDALQKLNLGIPTECKLYHTQLAQVFKEYMGYKLKTALSHKTTGDTLLALKDAQLASAMLTSASAALRGCDAVKFAKFMPPPDESLVWLNDIKNIIEQVEKQPILKP